MHPEFLSFSILSHSLGFSDGLGVKNLPAIQEMQEIQVIPGSGRSPGVGSGKPLQYVSLKNPMDIGAWQDAIRRFAKSRT